MDNMEGEDIGYVDPPTQQEIVDTVRQLRRIGLQRIAQLANRGHGAPPPTPIYVWNRSGEVIPAYAVMQVVGTTRPSGEGVRTFVDVRKPIDSSGTAGWYVVNGHDPIPVNKPGVGLDGPHVRVLGVDLANAASGDRYNPQPGSWLAAPVAPDEEGLFIYAGIDPLRGTNTVHRMFFGGGGSGEIVLARIKGYANDCFFKCDATLVVTVKEPTQASGNGAGDSDCGVGLNGPENKNSHLVKNQAINFTDPNDTSNLLPQLELTVQNRWALEGIKSTGVIIELVYNMDTGESEWQLVQREDALARWIWGTINSTPGGSTGSPPTLSVTIEGWDEGANPMKCFSQVPVVITQADACPPPDGSWFIAAWMPKAKTYRLVNTESGLLGKPLLKEIVTREGPKTFTRNECAVTHKLRKVALLCAGDPIDDDFSVADAEVEVVTPIKTDPITNESSLGTAKAYVCRVIPGADIPIVNDCPEEEPVECSGTCTWRWPPGGSAWELESPCPAGCNCGPAPDPPSNPANEAFTSAPCVND